MAQQKTWLPDDATKNCVGCKKSFTFSRRKHHCRACGRLFCGDCSTDKIELPHRGLKGQQRVCAYCFSIEKQRLYWNTKGVPALQSGSIMLIHNRFSSDSRLIKLSDNQQTIEILESNGKKLKDSFSLNSCDHIVSGKTTANLKKAKNVTASACFAIVGKKTYEFEAADRRTREMWKNALEAILFVNKQVDPKEIGKQAQDQYMATQYDKSKTKQFAKNQKKRDGIRKKYNLD
eukprot:UN09596